MILLVHLILSEPVYHFRTEYLEVCKILPYPIVSGSVFDLISSEGIRVGIKTSVMQSGFPKFLSSFFCMQHPCQCDNFSLIQKLC